MYEMTQDEGRRGVAPGGESVQEAAMPPQGEAGTASAEGAPVLRIKYNGVELELGEERARALAQKGMNYDKILRERDELRARATDAGTGVQPTGSVSGFDEARETEALRAQGYDDEQVQEVLEARRLRAQLAQVRAQMRMRAQAQPQSPMQPQAQMQPEGVRRVREDLAAFRARYPGVDYRDGEAVPAEVWEQVRAGMSLTDAYGRYAAQRDREAGQAAQTNERNRAMAAPAARSDGSAGGAYFTEDQVRGMTQAEVNRYYDTIVRSMPRWGAR